LGYYLLKALYSVPISGGKKKGIGLDPKRLLPGLNFPLGFIP